LIGAPMSSEKRVAANRQNARRSTGPRTARGISRSSRNALRHGLSAITLHNPAFSAQIERIAKLICGEGAKPKQYEQALIIAECQVIIFAVRAARLAAIKRRLPKPGHERRLPGFPSDEEWTDAIEALTRGRPRQATELFYRAARSVRAFTKDLATAADKVDNKTNAESHDKPNHEPHDNFNPEPYDELDQKGDAVEASSEFLRILESSPKRAEAPPSSQMRDEVAAFQHALPELLALERYERRALSRRQRAIRNYDAYSYVAAVGAFNAEVMREKLR
jgi:hypothetical protein